MTGLRPAAGEKAAGTRRGARALAAAVFMAVAASTATAQPYVLVAAEARPDAGLSPLGRQVFNADRERLLEAESAHVIGYARSINDLDDLMQEAEFATADIGQRLVLPEPSGKLHIFLVRNDDTWKKLARDQRFRPDSLAVQAGSEIFLRDDPTEAPRADRVSHEIIHYRLHQAYGSLPLWLDEGLAGYFGVKIAKAYRQTRDRRLTGQVPAILQDDLLPLDDVTKANELPTSPAAARAFYREAEEIVAELGWEFGDDKLPQFVQRVGDGENWRVVLEGGYGYTPQRFEELERAVRRRATEEKEF